MTPRTSAGQRLLDWLGGVGVVANDELRRRVAEVEAEAGALDRAWEEAEAALPEGQSVGVTSTVGVSSGPYVATTSYGPVERGYAYADSPAAALLELARRLREAD